MRENAELWRLQSRMNNLANRQMSEQLSRSFSGIGPLAGAGYGRLGSVGGLGLGYGAGLCPYGLGMGKLTIIFYLLGSSECHRRLRTVRRLWPWTRTGRVSYHVSFRPLLI